MGKYIDLYKIYSVSSDNNVYIVMVIYIFFFLNWEFFICKVLG